MFVSTTASASFSIRDHFKCASSRCNIPHYLQKMLQYVGQIQQKCSQTSGLDKDLDQWVFHPLLFNLMSILLPT